MTAQSPEEGITEISEPPAMIPNSYRLQGRPDILLPLRWMGVDDLRIVQESILDRCDADVADLRMITHALKNRMRTEEYPEV